MGIDKDIQEIKKAIEILADETPFNETLRGDRYSVSGKVNTLRQIISSWHEREKVAQDAYIRGFIDGKKQAKKEAENE